jgi:hypothetical protein
MLASVMNSCFQRPVTRAKPRLTAMLKHTYSSVKNKSVRNVVLEAKWMHTNAISVQPAKPNTLESIQKLIVLSS